MRVHVPNRPLVTGICREPFLLPADKSIIWAPLGRGLSAAAAATFVGLPTAAPGRRGDPVASFTSANSAELTVARTIGTGSTMEYRVYPINIAQRCRPACCTVAPHWRLDVVANGLAS